MNHKPLFLTILFVVSIIASGCGPSATPTPTVAPVVPPTAMPTATDTAMPVSTPTEEPTATIAPTPQPGSIQVSPADGMEAVYVPAGDFNMGSNAGTADEQPVHTVFLDAFWIDRTEITNRMYNLCVKAGECGRPYTPGSNTHNYYYDNPQYANYPVVDLRWTSAEKYCAWAGMRLPTEAEWEKAARGTDERTYPWGNANPNNSLLNFNNPTGDTEIVGKFVNGASPYGALDMAGNVMEWVADWYDAGYYAVSPDMNPKGPADGQNKVLRGGSWFSDLYSVRSADRAYNIPSYRNLVVGFRCAITAP
jgi:eukaryotic-like serine/threonine-protein kinase